MGETIRDIIFDLGNVIAPLDRSVSYDRLERLLPADRGDLLRRDREGFEERIRGPAVELESGRMDFAEFTRLTTDILGAQIPDTEFHRIWCDIFTVDEDVVRLGTFLSRRYGVWLASNTNRPHYEWIVGRFPRITFYRAAALSCELGVMKPAPEFFEKALAMFGVNRRRAVFIDDLEENVEGAIRVGLRGIVFKNCERLTAELVALNVQVPGEGS